METTLVLLKPGCVQRQLIGASWTAHLGNEDDATQR